MTIINIWNIKKVLAQLERNQKRKKELYLRLCYNSTVKLWSFENYEVIISSYRCNPGNWERPINIMICASFKVSSKHFTVVSKWFLGWYDVVIWQPQISDEIMLRTSAFEFTTLNNVESALSISTLISTTLGNVKKTLSFQRRFSQRWTISKQRREYEHLLGSKKINLESKRNKIFLSFKQKPFKLNTLNSMFSSLYFQFWGENVEEMSSQPTLSRAY